MTLALAEARRAGDEGEVPVGAVIVSHGAVVACGRNARERRRDPTAHAEILALRLAARRAGTWRLDGQVLYVTLEPCPMCIGACLNARIARIVYAAREPKTGACGSIVDLAAPPGFNHALEVLGGCRAEESAELLRSFFRRRR